MSSVPKGALILTLPKCPSGSGSCQCDSYCAFAYDCSLIKMAGHFLPGRRVPRKIRDMMAARKPQALRSVSDTALLVAYHRAMETKRPDALFRDQFALRVSEGRGEEIARKLPYGRRMAWSTVVRTVLFDELVLRHVSNGAGTVINLAAGLDARPYRLPVPPSLRWIEVDLPEMIREKNDALAAVTPHCRVERIVLDLSHAGERRRLLAKLGAESRDALVLSEGLLVYLTPQVVGELADDLHASASFRHWVIDLATPMIRKRVNRCWGKKLRQAQTSYQFAPEEGTGFFAPHGWVEAEFLELFEHSLRLDRTMSGLWMFKLISKLMPRRTARMMKKWRAGVVLLERRQDSAAGDPGKEMRHTVVGLSAGQDYVEFGDGGHPGAGVLAENHKLEVPAFNGLGQGDGLI